MTSLCRKMVTGWGTIGCATGTALVTCLMTTAQLCAADFTCITNKGSITITGFTGPGKVVVIPSTINGVLVSSIGEGAFSECTNFTEIRIPNSVTSIGRSAFRGFSGRIEVYKAPSIGSRVPAESGTNLWTERVMLPLRKGMWMSTLVGYPHKDPGPWAAGNCLSFGAKAKELEGRRAGMADAVQWRVFNMHAENFTEITKRLGLASVEAEVVHRRLMPDRIISAEGETVQMVDIGDCIITDARIPKDWFRTTPCICYSKADWRGYVATYPDKFNVAEKR